jgi:hypothetical protein
MSTPIKDGIKELSQQRQTLLLARKVPACMWAKPAQSGADSPFPLTSLMGIACLLTWIGPDPKFTFFLTS